MIKCVVPRPGSVTSHLPTSIAAYIINGAPTDKGVTDQIWPAMTEISVLTNIGTRFLAIHHLLRNSVIMINTTSGYLNSYHIIHMSIIYIAIIWHL